MSKVLVIAGTADAKQIIDKLLEMKIRVVAAVTTRLGSDLLKSIGDIDIREGQISQQRIVGLLDEISPICLVDASNPFAMEVSRNAMNACKKGNIPYIRFEREEMLYDGEDIIRVKDYEEALKILMALEGNIMLTVGSGKMESFTRIPDYKDRIYLRVLPDCKVIAKCEKIGFNAKNLIAMKGPFTEQLNIELLKYCNASVLVTKESGNTGGVLEKINAARKLGIPVIMIERTEVGYENKVSSVEEVLDFVATIKASCSEDPLNGSKH